MSIITKDALPGGDWELYRKKVPVRMIRMEGPFTVATKEGTLSCQDGWLALDSSGYPYPVADADHRDMYEKEKPVVRIAISLTPEEQELLLTDPYHMPGAEGRLWQSIAVKILAAREDPFQGEEL